MTESSHQYIGRFAPSPTGPLHLGSLLSAVGSYLDALKNRGKWLLRIEDTDFTRIKKEYIPIIFQQLHQYGFRWNDEEVIYQLDSTSISHYQNALKVLAHKKKLYESTFSRKELDAYFVNHNVFLPQERYCPIDETLLNQVYFDTYPKEASLRVMVDDRNFAFQDRLIGLYSENLFQKTGDFILYRKDGVYAYQLAVVVDDYRSGVNHVVRGVDLLDNTPRQIYLQELLEYPVPEYLHLPLLVNQEGQKWSKQTRAPSLSLDKRDILNNLKIVLMYLGIELTYEDIRKNHENPCEILNWAIEYFDINKIQSQSIKINL